uniref:VP n=1 Tax=Lorikeet parvoviridae sp. TaxID=2794565 RepID=A0A8A4XCT7_9VIRU|nr:MAG: VP [Lorikeet parvoviridae sp.]
MVETVTYSNVYMCYIQNQPYQYPADNYAYQTNTNKINTGYHVLPNFLFRHYLTPKDWADLQIHYEAYHVEAASATIFNMIPMTTQLAIQGTNVFTAFNNTIYAIGYSDKLYETSWEDWEASDIKDTYVPNLAWKEGQNKTVGGTTTARNRLPVYLWKLPVTRASSDQTWANWDSTGGGVGVWPSGTSGSQWPSGIFWDPLNRPDEIQELRPGKNSMTFNWQCHSCDENIWFNMDQIAHWWPWTPSGPYHHNRPGTFKLSSEDDPDQLATRYQRNPWINDYTIPNWANIPICDPTWFWKEMQQSIVEEFNKDKPDLRFPGTEYEKYKYPPEQWFLKMIPLFNDAGTLIEITANISVKISLTLKVKKRRSAIYAPTYGPFAWRNVYSAQTMSLNFQNSFARYRTAGARRTWQNIAQTAGENYTQTGHPREDPYLTSTVACGTGAASTVFTYTTTTATDHNAKLPTHTTYTTIDDPPPQMPIAPKRKIQHEPKLPIQDLVFSPLNCPDTQL